MEVELIPVIEINCSRSDIAIPTSYPYWENPALWDLYRRNCLSAAGFSESLKPYLPGYPLYPIATIQEQDLVKIITEHTEGLRTAQYKRDEAVALPGGYILRANNEDAYFPQCCGELSDIGFWEEVANGNTNSYDEGHPTPVIKMRKGLLVFDFTEYEEPFKPIPVMQMLKVHPLALQNAVLKAKNELTIFSTRLQKINIDLNWDIEEIDELLIWSNQNR